MLYYSSYLQWTPITRHFLSVGVNNYQPWMFFTFLQQKYSPYSGRYIRNRKEVGTFKILKGHKFKINNALENEFGYLQNTFNLNLLDYHRKDMYQFVSFNYRKFEEFSISTSNLFFNQIKKYRVRWNLKFKYKTKDNITISQYLLLKNYITKYFSKIKYWKYKEYWPFKFIFNSKHDKFYADHFGFLKRRTMSSSLSYIKIKNNMNKLTIKSYLDTFLKMFKLQWKQKIGLIYTEIVPSRLTIKREKNTYPVKSYDFYLLKNIKRDNLLYVWIADRLHLFKKIFKILKCTDALDFKNFFKFGLLRVPKSSKIMQHLNSSKKKKVKNTSYTSINKNNLLYFYWFLSKKYKNIINYDFKDYVNYIKKTRLNGLYFVLLKNYKFFYYITHRRLSERIKYIHTIVRVKKKRRNFFRWKTIHTKKRFMWDWVAIWNAIKTARSSYKLGLFKFI